MSLFRPVSLLPCSFLLATSLVAQQPPPRRDSQALAVLIQMTAASGWGAVPADAVATGSVTVETPNGLETKRIVIKAGPVAN